MKLKRPKPVTQVLHTGAKFSPWLSTLSMIFSCHFWVLDFKSQDIKLHTFCGSEAVCFVF